MKDGKRNQPSIVLAERSTKMKRFMVMIIVMALGVVVGGCAKGYKVDEEYDQGTCLIPYKGQWLKVYKSEQDADPHVSVMARLCFYRVDSKKKTICLSYQFALGGGGWEDSSNTVPDTAIIIAGTRCYRDTHTPSKKKEQPAEASSLVDKGFKKFVHANITDGEIYSSKELNMACCASLKIYSKPGPPNENIIGYLPVFASKTDAEKIKCAYIPIQVKRHVRFSVVTQVEKGDE